VTYLVPVLGSAYDPPGAANHRRLRRRGREDPHSARPDHRRLRRQGL